MEICGIKSGILTPVSITRATNTNYSRSKNNVQSKIRKHIC